MDDVVCQFATQVYSHDLHVRFGLRFGCHIVPFVWLQVSRLRLQNLRRSADAGGGSPHERRCLLLLSMAAISSLGLCSFGWAATQ